jgi:7-cyano-7-deazaguanine synthase
MFNKLVIFSGGIDSTVLLESLVRDASLTNSHYRITALTFNYGQRHIREIECATRQIVALKNKYDTSIRHITESINIKGSALTDKNINVPIAEDVLGDPQPVTYVPNRNAIMLMIAASIAEANECDRVYYGAQGQDSFSGYWDTSPEFLERINSVLELNRQNRIKVEAPFINYTKSDIVKLGIEFDTDFELTHTCYNPSTDGKLWYSCGVCLTCANRIQSFKQNNIKDPLDYEIQIKW